MSSSYFLDSDKFIVDDSLPDQLKSVAHDDLQVLLGKSRSLENEELDREAI